MVVVAIVAAALAGIGYVAVFRSPGAPARAAVADQPPVTVVPNAEGGRLARSAIATPR